MTRDCDCPPRFSGLVDAFDVPVWVRDMDTLRRAGPWGCDWPWQPATPLDEGDWIATTTWRHILQAAFQVGGDPERWLRDYPELAATELVARACALRTMLQVRESKELFPCEGTGRGLFVTPLYACGAEASAKAAFAYQLGMAMAHWITVGMSGLSGTQHLEMGAPASMSPFSPGSTRIPDLWGHHPTEGIDWLIEAKAGRGLNANQLRSGREQLDYGSALLNGVPHRQVLCGTSLPDNRHWRTEPVYMMVHTAMVNPAAPRPTRPTPMAMSSAAAAARDEAAMDAVVALVDKQSLVYLTLTRGPVEDLRIHRPARTDTRDGRERPSGVVHLETPLRHHDADQTGPQTNFLTGRLPGTGIRVGISRRLFAASRAADWIRGNREHNRQFSAANLAPAGWPVSSAQDPSWLEENRQLLRRETWAAFQGSVSRWTQEDVADLPGRPLRGAPARAPQLLEAVSEDTYLATWGPDPLVFGTTRR